MWVFPLTLGLITAVFLAADGGFLGGVYLVLLVLAGLGLWLVRPEPAPAAEEVA